jgi:glucans biosynthesis protein
MLRLASVLIALAALARPQAPPEPAGDPRGDSQTATATAAAPPPDSFVQLCERAKDLASRDYVARDASDLPEWLAKLDYDGYRQLRFLPESALWTREDLPFRVHLMHRGYLFPRRVKIEERVGADVHEVESSPTQFAYPEGSPPVPPGLGFSGLSLSWRAPDTGRRDEIAEWQGASYYRVLGVGQVYGASARGLAIDVAEPKGEEFPEFTELHVQRPQPGDERVVVEALLDSPGLAGAFRFVVQPGARTSADVTALLYTRHPIGKLGLAPLTTMFLFGEDGLHRRPDWRPEVHDSDGLLVAAGDGSWTWRPLANPTRNHRITRLPLENPRGFGLLQRDRAFASYADLESRFELRPSYWITPHGDWGKGSLELIEIPNEGEWNENVIASWLPEQPVAGGQELRLEYTISSQLEEPERPPLARVTATRVRPGANSQLFVIDFDEGAPPASDGPDGAPAPKTLAEVTASRGELRHHVLEPNTAVGGWRCSFELLDDKPEPVELRVTLKRGEQAVSETLLLTWARP